MTRTHRFHIAAILALALAGLSLGSCSKKDKQAGLLPGIYAHLETSRGTIIVELDYRRAPLAVANFIGLAEGTLEASWNRKFYDGLTFHQVSEGFAIQSGCPVGDGSGTPGYIFPDEFHPQLAHDAPGVIGMSNAGPDTNGSQFYITLDALPPLNGKYTVFGRTVSGLDILPKIRRGDKLVSVRIYRVGADAIAFKTDQEAWQSHFENALVMARSRMQQQRRADLAAIAERWPDFKPGTLDILSTTLQSGSGPKPALGTTVKVHYTGMLPDGRVFDRSDLAGEPFSFEVGIGQVIEGWDVIVGNMSKGEKVRVALPPELAYGTTGIPGVIPGNSFLIFEIELLDF